MENNVSVSKLLLHLKATIRRVSSSGLNASHGWAHGQIPFTHGGATGERQRRMWEGVLKPLENRGKSNSKSGTLQGTVGTVPAWHSSSRHLFHFPGGPAFRLSDSVAVLFFSSRFQYLAWTEGDVSLLVHSSDE